MVGYNPPSEHLRMGNPLREAAFPVQAAATLSQREAAVLVR